MIVVVAEKPSVARDLAQELGASQRRDGYFEGGGYYVTWAIGHLVALGEPHDVNPTWKNWNLQDLPLLPERWPLMVVEQTRGQFKVLQQLLNETQVSQVICATDAGREGELIFRYIYEATGCDKSVQRLWISSLTPEAIRAGFASLQPSSVYDGLADSARGRNQADWLVGINLSRLYSLLGRDHLSVGRVQTPTLAMVVTREREILDFVPQPYYEVEVTHLTQNDESTDGATMVSRLFQPDIAYDGDAWKKGQWKNPARLMEASRWDDERHVREVLLPRCEGATLEVVAVEHKKNRMAPPLLPDLTELQRQANRLFGFSAQKTLDVAQELYERHKLISYPRTDSRYLPEDVASRLQQIMSPLVGDYPVEPEMLARSPGKRFVQDKGVTDHHAIIPTGQIPRSLRPGSDEARLFDLICRRTLMMWMGDCETSSTTVILTTVDQQAPPLHAWTRGTVTLEDGWKKLEIKFRSRKNQEESAGEDSREAIPSLKRHDRRTVVATELHSRETQPPDRLTEAALLTAMESAGARVEDKELADAMREGGLGTPATRASIIETLLHRGFMERRGKSLVPTPKGMQLIATVHPDIKSPALTGEWELMLNRIVRGKLSLTQFSRRIRKFVADIVKEVQATPESVAETLSAAVYGVEDLERLVRERFGHDGFRPHQQAVCVDVVQGHDVLLVMPTGAGKSLCYQLPGVARGGTTIVISPLIALMEDQVRKLQDLGFRAERIHSGRDRQDSQQVCRAYISGQLDFLFVAPERLAVQGFVPLLAQRRPALVAIDEAHCISHWGHDFRPDYRMLRERLRPLQPVTTIAMTATATPLVQRDIVQSLGLNNPHLHIHGFRRTNLAIEVAEVPINDRLAIIRQLLQSPTRRPAIIYTPTRKQAEEWADELKGKIQAMPYHAGMVPDRRKAVQDAFAGGTCDVIVATTAFGMGIDKGDIRTVIHTALPGSLEGYYQEIGRAGRDGALARAILLYSFADLKTQEFFLKKNYPEMADLQRVLSHIPKDGVEKDALGNLFDPITLDNILEKLWIHGGVARGVGDMLTPGPNPRWAEAYAEQRDYKKEQLDRVERYAKRQSHCRMLSLMEHFGDPDAGDKSCQICDVCAPAATLVKKQREISGEECDQALEILSYLEQEKRASSGRLYRDVFEKEGVHRDQFESLLSALQQARLVDVRNMTFRKNQYDVGYQEISLAAGYVPPQRQQLEQLMVVMTATPKRKPKLPTGKAGSRGKFWGRQSRSAR